MQLELTEYMNGAVARLVGAVTKTMLRHPAGLRFLLRAKGQVEKAAALRKMNEQRGLHVPPFLIASITERCNLACAGCYAAQAQSGGESMTADEWDAVFTQAAELGVSFVLLAGGEPLLERAVLQRAAQHPEILFPVFTNGTLALEFLPFFEKHRHILPVFSIEGAGATTDARRGAGVYRQVFAAMQAFSKKGLLFGCSVTVGRSNMGEVQSDAFLRGLSRAGCHLCFYVEYVPAQQGTEAEAFTDADRAAFETGLEKAKRTYQDIVFVSFPGDEAMLGGCLAAGRGFFHINASGGAEPCPFAPVAKQNLRTHSLRQVLQSDYFQQVQALEARNALGGCALFHQKEALEQL